MKIHPMYFLFSGLYLFGLNLPLKADVHLPPLLSAKPTYQNPKINQCVEPSLYRFFFFSLDNLLDQDINPNMGEKMYHKQKCVKVLFYNIHCIKKKFKLKIYLWLFLILLLSFWNHEDINLVSILHSLFQITNVSIQLSFQVFLQI